jgi:hypothetical protein
MTWITVANLIVTVGLPATEKIIAKWANGTPVTPEEFAEVRATAQTSARDRLKAQLVKAGVALDSEQAKQLLALIE